MAEPFIWLLAALGAALLAGWQVHRRRAEAKRRATADVARAAAEREARRQADLDERRAAALARTAHEAADQARAEAEQAAAAAAAALARASQARAEAERAAAARADAERDALAHALAERAEAERLAAARAEAGRMATARSAAERRVNDPDDPAAPVRPTPGLAPATAPRTVKRADQTLVMVADDSKVVRVKTGRLLAQQQFQVCFANDGLDALQQLRERVPDILITDVEMPGMDGFELTQHVRGNPLTARIPVIMITAADDRHRERADQVGVSVLLGKPFPEDELVAQIRRAMGQDAAPSLTADAALDALA